METWKCIEGFKNYKISNTGRVKSNFFRIQKDLNHANNGRGYLTVCLYKDKKQKRMSVHRLVALHFIDNPLKKPDVNHKDGNKANNHIDNLEWVTKSENIRHGFELGLFDNSRKKSSERLINYMRIKREQKQLQL
jgi:hypothetical protein